MVDCTGRETSARTPTTINACATQNAPSLRFIRLFQRLGCYKPRQSRDARSRGHDLNIHHIGELGPVRERPAYRQRVRHTGLKPLSPGEQEPALLGVCIPGAGGWMRSRQGWRTSLVPRPVPGGPWGGTKLRLAFRDTGGVAGVLHVHVDHRPCVVGWRDRDRPVTETTSTGSGMHLGSGRRRSGSRSSATSVYEPGLNW